jgi:hypothetical protein
MAKDGVLPIIFTEYLIGVPKDYCNIARKVSGASQTAFGALESIFGAKVNTKTCQMADVGHAGVLFWNARGSTRYAEFGRYGGTVGGTEIGLTRFAKGGVPDLRLGASGMPTPASLKVTLKACSTAGGHGSRVSGVLIQVPGKFAAMETLVKARVALKAGLGANEYSISSNNCGTFVADVLLAADVRVEKFAQPDDFLGWLQARHPKVEYAPRHNALCVDGLVKERACI